MDNQYDRGIVTWLFTGCFFIFLMVIIGGITRLTHSGLSIVEWDVLKGTLPPMTEQAWMEMFEKYKQFPEYQKVHYYFTLSDFKSIFWWEYIHRLIARLILVVFLVPLIYFIVKGRITMQLMPKLIIIYVLGAMQGFMGWCMVKSGLIDNPHVSHFRLAAHLFLALITFSYIFWVALSEKYKGKEGIPVPQPLRVTGISMLVLLVLQMIYGALVAGLKAGKVYTTWPKMGSQWIAEGVTAMEPWWNNFLNGLAGVQFIHRYLAYVVLVLGTIIWYKSRRIQQTASGFLGFALLLQVILGIFTLVYAVPVSLGVIHQAFAFVLLAANLFFVYSGSGVRE